MSSRWYCQTEFGEHGPLSLEELLEQIEQGILQASSRLRKADSAFWQPARTVPEFATYFREATSSTESSAEALATTAPTETDDKSTASSLRAVREPVSLRSAVWIVSAVFVGLVFVYWGWDSVTQSQRFPEPRAMRQPKSDGFFFFGTGPWSLLEVALLWFDFVLIGGFVLKIAWCTATGRRDGASMNRKKTLH